MNEVRVSNFTSCVAESPGLELVDDASDTHTIRIHPETTASDDFIRHLNSSRVSIRDLNTDDGSAYLVVDVS
jgi:hypothetical protein